MKRLFALAVSLALTALSLVGCGGSRSTKASTSPQAGAVYVTGEDAPLSSVVSLNLTIKDTISGDAVLWAHRVREVEVVP